MNDSLDVGKIMRRVRDYAKYGKIDAARVFNMDEFIKNCTDNNLNWRINPEVAVSSQRRYIGSFIIIFKKLIRKVLRWYIYPIVFQLNEFNGSVTRSINEVYKIFDHLNEELVSYREEIEYCRRENEWMKGKLQEIEAQGISSEIQKITDCLRSESEMLTSRIKRLERKFSSIGEVSGPSEVRREAKEQYPTDSTKGKGKFDYFLFEQKFRGSEDEVKNNQRVYLKYFSPGDKVVDIGCGRGEFMELLVEMGAKAKGIDLNEDFVEYCKDKDLDVENADAITYLKMVEGDSLDGIFMAHLVEHLEFEELYTLLELCYEKIKKNSRVIVETPNPRTLSIFTNAFYADPTHIKPVHPETLKFLLDTIGFKKIEVNHYEHSKVNYSIPLLVGENVHNLFDFNNGINVLNSMLFGYQDYTVVAQK